MHCTCYVSFGSFGKRVCGGICVSVNFPVLLLCSTHLRSERCSPGATRRRRPRRLTTSPHRRSSWRRNRTDHNRFAMLVRHESTLIAEFFTNHDSLDNYCSNRHLVHLAHGHFLLIINRFLKYAILVCKPKSDNTMCKGGAGASDTASTTMFSTQSVVLAAGVAVATALCVSAIVPSISSKR